MFRRGSQVVRPGSAKALSRVRFPPSPPPLHSVKCNLPQRGGSRTGGSMPTSCKAGLSSNSQREFWRARMATQLPSIPALASKFAWSANSETRARCATRFRTAKLFSISRFARIGAARPRLSHPAAAGWSVFPGGKRRIHCRRQIVHVVQDNSRSPPNLVTRSCLDRFKMLGQGITMKKSLLLLGVLALLPLAAKADMRIPSSVFTMEEIEEAKAEALEEEEPLIFVYTDPGTS